MSENINPCENCQKRIDRIKQEHKDKEWLGEVVNEIREGCMEVKGHHDNLAVLDGTVGQKCPKCNEFYTSSYNFHSPRKTIRKEVYHFCGKDNKTERERVLNYFKQNSIKSIKLENNKLMIEYNDKQEKETKEINNQELQKIKAFAEKIGKNELALSDLEQSSNSSNSPETSNKGLYIGLAVVGVLVVGVIVWLLMRNKKEK